MRSLMVTKRRAFRVLPDGTQIRRSAKWKFSMRRGTALSAPESGTPLRQEVAASLGYDPFDRPSLQKCMERARTMPPAELLGLLLYLVQHAQRNSFVALKTVQRLERDCLGVNEVSIFVPPLQRVDAVQRAEADAMAPEAKHG